MQKHASRIIYFKDKLTFERPLFKKLYALNIYQLNNNTLLFMHKLKNNDITNIFKNSFNIKKKQI